MSDNQPTLRPSAPHSVPPHDHARLVLLAGQGAGRKYPVTDGVIIGRGGGSGISIDDGEVSRRHARLRRVHGRFHIEDLGSRNGTSVNGVPLTEAQMLTYGDRIQLGSSVVLLFTHHDPLEEQALRRQRMEALGRLAAGIAHDFNNLLGAVASSAEFLKRLPPEHRLDDTDVRDCLADVRTATARATHLTAQMLELTDRQSNAMFGPLDVTVLCQDAGQLARRICPSNIEISIEGQPGLHISGDGARLHRVLTNLVFNARDAMPDGGTLRIDACRASAELADACALPSDRSYVLITVTDTGSGMAGEAAQHAFEPFFTTKSGDRGAGLGLTTALEIVAAHNGHLGFESAEGVGTTFRILLPAATTLPKAVPARSTAPPPDTVRPTRHRPVVLVVDDEAVVRRSTARVLRSLGYDVREAADGEDGVEAVRSRLPRPDVILLDLDMPRLDGAGAFRQIQELAPRVPVIFVSGYWDDAREKRLRAEGAHDFLRKPYKTDTLAESLAQALAARGPKRAPRE